MCFGVSTFVILQTKFPTWDNKDWTELQSSAGGGLTPPREVSQNLATQILFLIMA